MRNKKTILILAMLFLIAASNLAIAVEPIVEYTINPTEPEKLSTITITATITTDINISEVRLIVQECSPQICYSPGFNVSMTQTTSIEYQGQVTLTHDDSTYIKYYVEILAENIWYNNYTINQLTLTIPSTGDTGDNGTNNGDNNDNDTPGFELLTFIIAIAIITLLIRKKR